MECNFLGEQGLGSGHPAKPCTHNLPFGPSATILDSQYLVRVIARSNGSRECYTNESSHRCWWRLNRHGSVTWPQHKWRLRCHGSPFPEGLKSFDQSCTNFASPTQIRHKGPKRRLKMFLGSHDAGWCYSASTGAAYADQDSVDPTATAAAKIGTGQESPSKGFDPTLASGAGKSAAHTHPRPNTLPPASHLARSLILPLRRTNRSVGKAKLAGN